MLKAFVPFVPLVLLLLSPTLWMLWGAFQRLGWTWNLLLIPVGTVVGGVGVAIATAYIYDFLIWLDDRKTGPPEAGSLGAGVGRGIMLFIWMGLYGWMGSILGAWLVAHYWVGGR